MIEDSVNLKGRHGAPGEVKPYMRTTVKREWSPSRQVWEEVTRVFDSDARIYTETYRNLDTGEITFHKEGAIEDQGLHGPAARPALGHRRPDTRYAAAGARCSGLALTRFALALGSARFRRQAVGSGIRVDRADFQDLV
jgi:hypothetical protein